MASVDFSKYGGSQEDEADFSQYGGSKEQEQKGISAILSDILNGASQVPSELLNSIKSLPSTLNKGASDIKNMSASDIAKNILAGTASTGKELFNAPYNFQQYLESKGIQINPLASKVSVPHISDNDYGKLLNVPKNTGSQLLQSIPSLPVYAMSPESAELNTLSKIAKGIGRGAAVGSAMNKDPIKGLLLGAASEIPSMAISGVSKGLNTIFGTKKAINDIGNKALDYLQKQNEKYNALSPEDAAENLSSNYTLENGNPMKVDIGTLSNNPTLQKLYRSGNYVPYSGVTKNLNQLNAESINKKFSDNARQFSELESQNLVNKQQASLLKQKINELNQYKSDHLDRHINDATNYINRLPNAAQIPNDLNQSLRNEVKNAFDKNKKISDNNYAPINSENIRLDKISDPENDFKGYMGAANDLDIKRDSLVNLFGKNDDLSQSLNKELDSAITFKDSGKNHAMSLEDGLSRIRNLGQLSAAAKSRGKYDQAALLQKLRWGLKGDIDKILTKNGRSDLVKSINDANKFHEHNVIPFYNDSEIRKSVTRKNYIPEENKLTNNLHSSENRDVLNLLPQNAKDIALFQLVTGGKYGSKGITNLDPEKIGANYQNIHGDIRRTISQYNPDADNFFENLSRGVAKRNDTQDLIRELNKSLSKIEKYPEQAKMVKLLANREDLKNKKFGMKKESASSAESAIKILKSIGGHGLTALGASSGIIPFIPAVSRTITKALSNPELLKAYARGSRLPEVSPSTLSKLLMKNPYRALIQSSNKGDNNES